MYNVGSEFYRILMSCHVIYFFVCVCVCVCERARLCFLIIDLCQQFGNETHLHFFESFPYCQYSLLRAFLLYEEFTVSRLDVHFNDSECSNKTTKLVALSGMYSQKAGKDVLS